MSRQLARSAPGTDVRMTGSRGTIHAIIAALCKGLLPGRGRFWGFGAGNGQLGLETGSGDLAFIVQLD